MGTDIARHHDLNVRMLFPDPFDQLRDIPGHMGSSLKKKRNDHYAVHILTDAALYDLMRGGRDILQESMLDNSE